MPKQHKQNTKYLIETYIGISESAAKTVYELVNELNGTKWVNIGSPRQKFLLNRRMFVMSEGVKAESTSYGRIASWMYERIMKEKFVPDARSVSDDQLVKLNDPQKLTKTHGARAYELLSVHIKLLRMVARVPGISMFHLYNVFAEHQLKHLLDHKLVRYAHGDSFQIFPAANGLDLLKVWVES